LHAAQIPASSLKDSHIPCQHISSVVLPTTVFDLQLLVLADLLRFQHHPGSDELT